jgi:diacylglycerol kinase family enzyme
LKTVYELLKTMNTGKSMSFVPSSPAPPLLIVMNAGSGHNDSAAVQQTIEEMLKHAGRAYRMFLIEDSDAARIAETARRAVKEAQACGGVVVAVGGDGTINTVATAVLGSGCTFGVIPQGTFNYFGRTHGIPENLEEAIEVLLRARVFPVQAGLVNNRLFLVNASIGLYPQLLEDREAFKHEYGRSRLVALWSGLVTAMRPHRQLRITLERQGQTTNMRTLTLLVDNNRLQMEQIGIPLAESLDKGQLVAVAVRPIGKFALLWLMARGALGRLGEAENVISFGFQRLTINPSSLYRTHRVKVATDGETVWMNAPLQFRVSPQPLYLLKPDPQSPAGNPPDCVAP